MVLPPPHRKASPSRRSACPPSWPDPCRILWDSRDVVPLPPDSFRLLCWPVGVVTFCAVAMALAWPTLLLISVAKAWHVRVLCTSSCFHIDHNTWLSISPWIRMSIARVPSPPWCPYQQKRNGAWPTIAWLVVSPVLRVAPSRTRRLSAVCVPWCARVEGGGATRAPSQPLVNVSPQLIQQKTRTKTVSSLTMHQNCPPQSAYLKAANAKRRNRLSPERSA